MDNSNILKELCKMELKQIRHCMKEGKMCDVKHCMNRLKFYKSIDLTGGASFWSEYLGDTGKQLKRSTREEIISYLRNHSPTPAQLNGAVQELTSYILETSPSTEVSEARNQALQLFGKDPEFITRFLAEEREQQESLQQLVALAPNNIIDLTNTMIQQENFIDLTNEAPVIDLTVEQAAENNVIDAQEKQLIMAVTISLFSVLMSSASVQAKAIALSIILLLYKLIEKNYVQAQLLLQNIRKRNN